MNAYTTFCEQVTAFAAMRPTCKRKRQDEEESGQHDSKRMRPTKKPKLPQNRTKTFDPEDPYNKTLLASGMLINGSDGLLYGMADIYDVPSSVAFEARPIGPNGAEVLRPTIPVSVHDIKVRPGTVFSPASITAPLEEEQKLLSLIQKELQTSSPTTQTTGQAVGVSQLSDANGISRPPISSALILMTQDLDTFGLHFLAEFLGDRAGIASAAGDKATADRLSSEARYVYHTATQRSSAAKANLSSKQASIKRAPEAAPKGTDSGKIAPVPPNRMPCAQKSPNLPSSARLKNTDHSPQITKASRITKNVPQAPLSSVPPTPPKAKEPTGYAARLQSAIQTHAPTQTTSQNIVTNGGDRPTLPRNPPQVPATSGVRFDQKITIQPKADVQMYHKPAPASLAVPTSARPQPTPTATRTQTPQNGNTTSHPTPSPAPQTAPLLRQLSPPSPHNKSPAARAIRFVRAYPHLDRGFRYNDTHIRLALNCAKQAGYFELDGHVYDDRPLRDQQDPSPHDGSLMANVIRFAKSPAQIGKGWINNRAWVQKILTTRLDGSGYPLLAAMKVEESPQYCDAILFAQQARNKNAPLTVRDISYIMNQLRQQRSPGPR